MRPAYLTLMLLIGCLWVYACGPISVHYFSPTAPGSNLTPTFTPSPSPTTLYQSPTPTGTPTSTPTACTAGAPLTFYGFDSGPMCWQFDGGNSQLSEYVAYSTTTYNTGPGAWMGVISNSGPTTQQEEIHITYPCASSPIMASGTTILMYVQATQDIDAQVFVYFGPNNTNCTNLYENPSYCSGGSCGQSGNYSYHMATNRWVPVTLITGFPGGVAQNVGKLGVDVLNITAGMVTIYLDDVSIAVATTPTVTGTPTPTATASSSFFDNGNYALAGWTDSLFDSPATLTNLISVSPGYGASVSAAGVSVTWSAINQSLSIQYNYSSPANWQTLGLTGFRFYANANPIPSDNAGVQPYCYSGGYEGSYYNYSTTGWQPLSFNPPFTAAGSSNTTVYYFGVQFGTGSVSTSWASNDLIEIGNVELY